MVKSFENGVNVKVGSNGVTVKVGAMTAASAQEEADLCRGEVAVAANVNPHVFLRPPSVARQKVDVLLGVILQLVGFDHDVGGAAERSVHSRRCCHQACMLQGKAMTLLSRCSNHCRIAKGLSHHQCIRLQSPSD